MKQRLKTILLRKGVYYKLRYSVLFRCYQYAYDGHKTEAFRHLAKKVISCEPDRFSFSILQDRFRNRNQVILENTAVADEPGTSHFFIHRPGSAFNTLSQTWKQTLEQDQLEKWDEKIKFTGGYTVSVTTLDLLIQKYGKPDFIKIDVEGYEEQVMRGLSVPVAFLSFEAMWPGGITEIQRCFDRLQSIAPGTLFNIAVYEKLLLPGFVGPEAIVERLRVNDITHLEIIAKMNP